eukprot:54199-Chlamydomonas_euryale.AAC.2
MLACTQARQCVRRVQERCRVEIILAEQAKLRKMNEAHAVANGTRVHGALQALWVPWGYAAL